MLHDIVHDVDGSRLWCGPAAIAAVTGLPTSLIHEAIKQDRRDRKPVRGVVPDTLLRVLRRFGYQAAVEVRGERIGFQAFAAKVAELTAVAPMVAYTKDHYFVLGGGQFVDSAGVPKPVEHAHVDGFVEFGFTLLKVSEPNLPAVFDPHKTADAMALAKARRLAAKHELAIERIAPGLWRVDCDLLADDDPHEDDHIVESGAAVLERVESYVHHLTHGYLEEVCDPAFMPPVSAGYLARRMDHTHS